LIGNMGARISWLGHSSFRITADKVLYFDPYRIPGGPAADIILISHPHFDHCAPEDVAKIQGKKTVIVTEKDSRVHLHGDVRVMKPGEYMTVGGVGIRAVPSYNRDKDFHPGKKRWLGFIVELEGLKIYHAGDTDFIPEMKKMKVDVALLPVSGTFVMTAEEAVEAALSLGPRLAVPMHYGAIIGEEADAIRFKEALAGQIEVTIPQEDRPFSWSGV
jgi:L-ascorbate metabolism protein UlaG (beta-lactamase superfamily)